MLKWSWVFFDPSEWLREICRKFPGDVAKMSCSQEWEELTDNMKTWSIWQLKNKTARYLYEQKLFHTVAAHCHIMSLKHIIWLSYLSFASAFFYTNRNFLCCSLILFSNHYLNLNLLPSFPLQVLLSFFSVFFISSLSSLRTILHIFTLATICNAILGEYRVFLHANHHENSTFLLASRAADYPPQSPLSLYCETQNEGFCLLKWDKPLSVSSRLIHSLTQLHTHIDTHKHRYIVVLLHFIMLLLACILTILPWH